ncbi:MAG: hypothetical protein SGBAC_002717 [Bacillariaceae sp.]
MEHFQRGISVAMVLTAQAQAQAQAFQAAVNAGQGGANSRNMWSMQGFPPPMLGGLPPNFFPHFHAAAQAQQEAATAMVGTAKLGTSSKVPSSNSKFVVRSSVRKFDSNGGLVSVGMWARKVVEDNLEWLVKLARRHSPSENAVILAYGDGCETLVLLDGQINTLPKDFSKLKKVGVGVSVALADSKVDEGNLANTGVLQAQDSIWEHLSFQTADVAKTKKEKAMFIHTSNTIWSTAIDGRRKVLQVKTKGPSDPHMAVCYAPNTAFEQKALSSWAVASGGSASGINMVPAPTSAVTTTVVAPTSSAPVNADTLISFNPKQLILLEKSFDNGLTPRDLKTDVKKTNAEDKKKCQMVIRRARDEIVITTKKRRKKTVAPAPAAKKAEAVPEKPAPKKADEKEASEDSDDEPISAIKKKPVAKRVSKAKSPAKPKATPKKAAEPKKEAATTTRKRGRPSTASAKKESTTKRTRSKSRTKK